MSDNKYGLYDYQVEALKATETASLGQVIMPTGTGKTFVQAAVLADAIEKQPGYGLYAINSPRLMLNRQLYGEVANFMAQNDVNVRFIYLGSGGAEEDLELRKLQHKKGLERYKLVSTTSAEELTKHIEKAQKANMPLIVVSTYDSIGRASAHEFDLMLCDEAHFITEPGKFANFGEVVKKRCYFFTATRQVTPTLEKNPQGTFMDNHDVYGDVLYKMPPRVAIDMGKMVRPRLHLVMDDTGVFASDAFEEAADEFIANTFLHHKETLVGRDAPKLLVATNGSKQLKAILEGTAVNGLDADVFITSSNEDIGNRINGVEYSRGEFLDILREWGSETDRSMVILHYNILSEGIDVPGITGVLFLRAMRQSKFLQNLGRASRLDLDDRAAFSAKPPEYGPDDLHKMDKPYAYAIIPTVTDDNKNATAQIQQYIDNMRDYKFDMSEQVVVSSIGSSYEPIEAEDLVPALHRQQRKGIADAIERLHYKLECERVAALGEQLKLVFADDLAGSL